MLIRILHIVGLLLLATTVLAQNYLFNTRYLTVEDGMLGRRVTGIVQDNEGFIWIGTNEGLNRFDGYHFEHFTKSSHGLSANNIYQMGIDDVGDIWITYWYDKFIIPETQIVRPKTGEIISIKEKLGAIYKPKHNQFRVVNNINIGQVNLGLHNEDSTWIYQDNRLLLRPTFLDYRFIHSPDRNYLYFINKDHTQVNQYDFNGKILDSIEVNLDSELYNLNFTQNGGLIASSSTDKESVVYYKEQSSSTFKPILKADGKEQFKYVQFGIWKDRQLYFEYQNQIVQFNASKLIQERPRKLIFDKQNNVWIATNNGVVILSIKPRRFRQYLKDVGLNKPIYDGRGIWANDTTLFAFSGSGSYQYNLQDDSKKLLYPPLERISSPNSVAEAKDGSIWIGTKNSLLINMDVETTDILQTIKGTVNQIWSICEDKEGRIWIGQNNNGLFYYEKGKTKDSRKYEKNNGFEDIEKGKITHIIADERDDNYLWLSCQSGWYLLHLKDGIKYRYWSRNEDKKFGIPADDIHFTYQDKDGDFWLATAYSGLVKVTLNTDKTVANTQQFTIQEGLTSNTVYAIYEDGNGFLWISTNNGINRFNKKTYEVQAFLEEDGLPHYEFNRLSNFQRKDGTIFFGTLNGIVSFHPNDLSEKIEYNVPLAISRCEKYADDVEKMVNVTTEVLIDNKIIIRPNERLVTLSVSLQNYLTSLQTKYLYRIKELQKEWVTANKNEIALNGLPYGSYTLEVKGKVPDGRFSKQILSIPLIVKRPFYSQWWFILLALISLALTVWQLFQTRTRVLQARKRELEEIIKDRTAQLREQATRLEEDKNIIEQQARELESLDRMKSRFFTNISHELRTPLTLILSPVRSIIKRQKTDNRDFTSAKIIEQNAQTLLKRINEILDLTKLEAREMELKPKPTLFYEFVKRLIAVFEGFVTEKEQQLTLKYRLDKSLWLQLDQDKYEHIFNNYLSNAIKFTPKGGKIHIELGEQQAMNDSGEAENLIRLSIKDNGQGIPESELEKVFDRFFQSTNNQNSVGSSGIGLALSKEIAYLMNGRVRVESQLGKGSTFFFEMPYVETLGNSKPEIRVSHSENTSPIILQPLERENQKLDFEDKSTILLVEDNTQLRNYIQIILQEKYDVITAENGHDALKKLAVVSNHQTVELIVSDIMMPKMSGFELLEQLRSRDEYRHLPMVMLTARSGLRDKLKALRIGVDDYILKPFQEEELMARIANLIANAKNRIGVVDESTTTTQDKTTVKKTVSASDLKWLEKVEKQLQTEISNSKFNIDSLAEVMNLSRSHLHRRIKTITGLTPNKYFREIKLQAAREILENGDAQTVSEVCYAVGFDTPKYFSKVYEQRFGKRPSTYF